MFGLGFRGINQMIDAIYTTEMFADITTVKMNRNNI